MRRGPAHQPHPSSCLCLLLLAGLTSCQAIPSRPMRSVSVPLSINPGALVRNYQEEYAYIQGWRGAVVGGQVNGVSDRPAAAWLSRPISLTWPFRRRHRVGHGSPGNPPGTLQLVGHSGLGATCQSADKPDTPRCQQSSVDDQGQSGRERAQLVIKKVAKPVESPKGKKFLQTSTATAVAQRASVVAPCVCD